MQKKFAKDGPRARLPTILLPSDPNEYNLAQAVKKKVFWAGLMHPGSLYPFAVGVTSAAMGLILGLPIFFLIALVGLTGPIWATIQICFLGGKLSSKLMKELRVAAQEKFQMRLEELEAKLLKFKERRAIEQLAELQKAFERFTQKLNDKIGQGEPEYDQWLATAQGMCLAAINNLVMIVDNAEDSCAIDEVASKRRIYELEHDGDPSNDGEIPVIQRKLECLKLAKSSSDELIKEVEGAITTLFEETRRLSDIGLQKEGINQTVKEAMEKFTATTARNMQVYNKIAETWRQLNQK